MKLLGVLLTVVWLLTGCSNVNEIKNDTEQGNVLTLSEINEYALNQLPDRYDWRCVHDIEANILMFYYDGFYLDLMDTQRYLEASKLKTDWYAVTNQMIRFQSRVQDDLEKNGV